MHSLFWSLHGISWKYYVSPALALTIFIVCVWGHPLIPKHFFHIGHVCQRICHYFLMLQAAKPSSSPLLTLWKHNYCSDKKLVKGAVAKCFSMSQNTLLVTILFIVSKAARWKQHSGTWLFKLIRKIVCFLFISGFASGHVEQTETVWTVKVYTIICQELWTDVPRFPHVVVGWCLTLKCDTQEYKERLFIIVLQTY